MIDKNDEGGGRRLPGGGPDWLPNKVTAPRSTMWDSFMTPGVVVVWSEHNAEALKWYRLAADQGDSTAQYNVGLFYDVVVWSEHNAGALKWYTRPVSYTHLTLPTIYSV